MSRKTRNRSSAVDIKALPDAVVQSDVIEPQDEGVNETPIVALEATVDNVAVVQENTETQEQSVVQDDAVAAPEITAPDVTVSDVDPALEGADITVETAVEIADDNQDVAAAGEPEEPAKPEPALVFQHTPVNDPNFELPEAPASLDTSELEERRFEERTEQYRKQYPRLAAMMDDWNAFGVRRSPVLRITSKVDGFRRAGISHLKTAVEHDTINLTPVQIEALLAEPNLVVEVI